MKKSEITVEYSEHMGSDLTVVNAARQSFNKQKAEFGGSDASLIAYLATGKRAAEWDAFLDEIMSIADKAQLKKRLIAYKREAQHWAPFGHPHLTLRLRMPVFLARQFVKHQVGGVWSEESRRYMDSDPEFYFETVLQGRPADIKQGAGAEMSEEDLSYCNALVKAATTSSAAAYHHLIRRKLAPEQAREILTFNMMTGVTWTGSLLFWSRVVNLRADAHAQGAARTLAGMIVDIAAPLYPVSWAALAGD